MNGAVPVKLLALSKEGFARTRDGTRRKEHQGKKEMET